MTLRHLSLFRHHFIPTIQTGYPFIHRTQRAFVCEKSGDGPYHLAGVGGKKAGQIVGRITAQIDTLHRERYGEDTGHFGMIDAIDDPQVFAALFGAAEAWLKSQGASKISGPFSLNINQESGLLIEGFDTPPCAMMPHGKPWYAAHIEQLGYHKGIDLLAWWMQRTDLTFSPALKKLMDQVRKR